MKNNNKGFIAISLIYSFFLVFLITLLAIVSDYAHNRILLNEVKQQTQEYLNGLAEFNPVYLKNKTYAPLEVVTFGSEKWLVISDDGTNVLLVLERVLNEEELTKSLNNVGIANASNEDKTLMCLDTYNPAVCNYQDSVVFNYYSWNNSIVKKIVEDWLLNDANLQKAISVGSMQNMNYSEGVQNYNTYIRIPLSTEFTTIQDMNIWYLTLASKTNGISTIKYGDNFVTAHNNYRNIRPVIMVKKTISFESNNTISFESNNKVELYENAQVGDYVSYTPSKTSYTTDTSYTGATSTQTINPSELNLWRVINITDTGVELVSEYVSSTNVTFRRLTGYQNYVGYLNILASQYETEGITIGSRYMGYNGQTEFITRASKLMIEEIPWISSTSSSTSSADEALGAGDTLYTTDVNLVENALGTLVAYNVSSTSSSTEYWLASRYYYSAFDDIQLERWSFNLRIVTADGKKSYKTVLQFNPEYGTGYALLLRPIVIVEPTLAVNGSGTAEDPWKLN